MFEIPKRFEHYVPNCFDKVLTRNINPTLYVAYKTQHETINQSKNYLSGTKHYITTSF